jgi:tripartite-type tricarboxylate transporter receptor subunit TctC
MTSIRLLVAAFAAAAAVLAQAADPYPSKPIRIYVGYTAGGAVDTVARAIGQQISASLGQPVIIENKPGAGTNIAIKALIDSPPDGYTLMLTGNSLAANMALFQPPPFEAERDVAPVALVGRVPVVLAAGATSEFTSLRQVIDRAKSSPGTVQYATPGNGSTPHFAMEMLASSAGVKLAHVPYKGGAQAITDVLGGQLPLVAVNALEALPQARAGKLRVLAVMSPTRTSSFPDVPTVAESGWPGFEATVWYGLIAPARTPKEIVDKLHGAVQQALSTADMRKRMSDTGGEVTPRSVADFGTLIHEERVRYEKLAREANIRPD